jgi:hypothetical protein
MKKGQQNNLTALFLAVVAVSAYTVFALLYVDSGANTYGVSYNNTIFNQLNQTGAISTLTLNTQQSLIGANSSSGASGGGIINTITTAGYQSFSLISSIPDILLTIFSAIAAQFGLPISIVILSFAMIVVSIISIVILLVFRVSV